MNERIVVARVQVRSACIDPGLYRNVQTGAFIEVCPAAPAKPIFSVRRISIAPAVGVWRAVGREMLSMFDTMDEVGAKLAQILFKPVDL